MTTTRHDIAVVICNWNKCEDVMACLTSLFASDLQTFDVIVVDNASTDDSVKTIQRYFEDKVLLLQNSRNVGGAGGFYIGIERAMSREYAYVMVLDNDVVIEPQTISTLRSFLNTHHEVGVVGAAIRVQQRPEQLQEFGARLDLETFNVRPLHKAEDFCTASLPEIEWCHYVPACAALVRMSVLRKAGNIDPAYFVYWDDIDWCGRIRQAGYRIAAISTTSIQHKMGVKQVTNTFGTYYFWRNRTHYFGVNLSGRHLQSFANVLFEDAFQAIFMSRFNEQPELALTIWRAIYDALQGIRGEAPTNRVFLRSPRPNRLSHDLTSSSIVVIHVAEDAVEIAVLLQLLAQFKDGHCIITGSPFVINKLHNRTNLNAVIVSDETIIEEPALHVHLCWHLTAQPSFESGHIYVDRFFNQSVTDRDHQYMNSYQRLYRRCHNRLFWHLVSGLERLQSSK